ncbi:MAG: hypothetical protein ACQ9MH_12400 [Nitrospinales bacterium]
MRLILGWIPIIFFMVASYRKAQFSGYMVETYQFLAMCVLDVGILIFFILPQFLIFAGAYEHVMKKRARWEVLSFPFITLVLFPAAPWVDLFSDTRFLVMGGLFIATFYMFFQQVMRTFISMGPYPKLYQHKLFGYYAPKSVVDFIRPRIHFFFYALTPIILKIFWVLKLAGE